MSEVYRSGTISRGTPLYPPLLKYSNTYLHRKVLYCFQCHLEYRQRNLIIRTRLVPEVMRGNGTRPIPDKPDQHCRCCWRRCERAVGRVSGRSDNLGVRVMSLLGRIDALLQRLLDGLVAMRRQIGAGDVVDVSGHLFSNKALNSLALKRPLVGE